MDLVPVINGIGANAQAAGTFLGFDIQEIRTFLEANGGKMLLFGLLLAFTFGFLRKIWKRVSRTVEDTMFSNWRLALLGATGLVLSLASGWTTWDGMRNFTGEPTLSLMITFGIQGVMLIVAWLIGESFATGMHLKPAERARHTWGAVGGLITGTIILAALAGLFFLDSLPVSSETILFGTVGVGIFALIAFLQWDLVAPYFQSSRIIMRNAVLWVMFLACMATSVFFSFDSLFSTIFPAGERARAAQLRAQNQVSGLVADIGQTITARRQAEAERLFSNPGWQAYEKQLDTLAQRSQGAEALIEKHFVDQMESRRAAVARQQERIATSASSQAGLAGKKIELTDELARLLAERPEAVSAVDHQSTIVAGLVKRLDEQRALTLAEERGVEGSGKEGRGKFWRASKGLERRIEAEIEVARKRLNAPQERLTQIDARIATIKGQLAQVDGEIAKLKGESQTASQRIAAVERTTREISDSERVDPSRVLPAFEKAKAAFRQDPSEARLSALHSQCTLLRDAMLSTPTTKEKVRDIDCDPKRAGEASAIVFALNVGAVAFANNCAGGEKLVGIPTTDGLFGFARQCLADSGLPSKATASLRAQINQAELNRDDKAHRFVVTWNAFQDGNRLAFLSLAIAIAIDALVFMSGLFGANAVRSPLQDVPSSKPRSANQLEAIIENALLPDKFANAHATIEAMQPITPVDGFTQEVIVPYEETPDRARVLKVLNAGSTIGAVARDPMHPERYLVRPELFEFLAFTAKTCFEKEKGLARAAELRQVVTVALQPYVGANAEAVLQHMHPINERNNCTSEIIMEQVPDAERSLVRKVLNAGMTLNFAQKDERKGEDDGRYYIHKDLFKTISLIAATAPRVSGANSIRPQIAGPARDDAAAAPVRYGGDLTQKQPPALAHRRGVARQHGADDDSLGSRLKAGDVAHGADPGEAADFNPNPLEIERFYRDDLVYGIGIQRVRDTQTVLGNEAAHQAAAEAWTALRERAGENQALSRYLDQFEHDRLKTLEARYQYLQEANREEPQEVSALNRARTNIDAAWPILMLHPDTGLVASLIEQLDLAASNDGLLAEADADLRERLHKARDILNAYDLGGTDAWNEIHGAIAELATDFDSDDMPNIARGSDVDGESDGAADAGKVIPIGMWPKGTNGRS